MTRLALTAAALATLWVAPALAQDAHAARATLSDTDGNDVGAVTVSDTPSGIVLVTVDVRDLAPGTHGVHFHETGDCSAPDFSSAGGHIAGDASHGVLSADGPHPGDLPNMTVGADGTGHAEYYTERLVISDMLGDGDGSAFIVHSGADDETTQPAGNAGDRVACGVFEVTTVDAG